VVSFFYIIFVVEKETTTKTITIMTVAELIDKLSQLPQDLNIEVDDGNYDYEIKYVDVTLSVTDLKTSVCSITMKPIIN
jgi:hypothetical protein